jgi:hypothetical protein
MKGDNVSDYSSLRLFCTEFIVYFSSEKDQQLVYPVTEGESCESFAESFGVVRYFFFNISS